MLDAAIFPAVHGLVVELANYFEYKKHKIKPSRSPDYIMFAPDFVSSSAGIRCLYKLCADLKKMGFEVAIHGALKGDPDCPIPILSLKEASKAANLGAWCIYPETVRGNPTKAKNVVRWVLNRPGLLGGEKVFPESEHVFLYSDVYAPYVVNTIRGRINSPSMDRDLFYPPQMLTHRTLDCFYVGKSKFKTGFFEMEKTFEISRHMPPRSELGKLFRASRMLYCFDNSTALVYEALVCGCAVTIIPDGTQTWEDYQKLELGTEGISWGVTDTKNIAFDPAGLQARLQSQEATYQKQVQFLVEYTQAISNPQATQSAKKKEREPRSLDLGL